MTPDLTTVVMLVIMKTEDVVVATMTTVVEAAVTMTVVGITTEIGTVIGTGATEVIMIVGVMMTESGGTEATFTARGQLDHVIIPIVGWRYCMGIRCFVLACFVSVSFILSGSEFVNLSSEIRYGHASFHLFYLTVDGLRFLH